MNEFWQGVIVGCGVWGLLFTGLTLAVALANRKGHK